MKKSIAFRRYWSSFSIWCISSRCRPRTRIISFAHGTSCIVWNCDTCVCIFHNLVVVDELHMVLSAYDNDDVIFRLLTFFQIFGLLVFIAGIASTMTENPNFAPGFIGFVIMRVVMVLQWLRAAKWDPQNRRTCLTYAVGLTIAQIIWGIFFFFPGDKYSTIALIISAAVIATELMTPILAWGRKICNAVASALYCWTIHTFAHDYSWWGALGSVEGDHFSSWCRL